MAPTWQMSAQPSHQGWASSSSSNHNTLSPRAGYLSEDAYAELSNETTPGIEAEADFLSVAFSMMANGDDHGFGDNSISAGTVPEILSSIPVTMETDPSATMEAQHAASTHDLQQHNPVVGNVPTSSLGPDTGEGRRCSTHRAVSADLDMCSGQHIEPGSMGLTSRDAEPTPGLTGSSRNSSNDRFLVTQTQTATQCISPVVKIENYGWDESTGLGYSLDMGSPNYRKPEQLSPAHLSPHAVIHGAFGDDVAPGSDSFQPDDAIHRAERAEDGSWIANPSTGQAGVDPSARGDATVDNLKEQEEHRKLTQRNAEVADWLVTSATTGRPGEWTDPAARGSLQVPDHHSRRPRAKSTGDVGLSSGPRPFSSAGVLDDSGIALPSVRVHDESEADEEDNLSDDSSPPVSPRGSRLNGEAEPELTPNNANKEPDDSFVGARPWVDPPSARWASDTKAQPSSSNAAIMRFRQKAENIETASRVATWGTRRMSDSDAEMLSRESTMLKRFSFGKDKDKTKAKGDKNTFSEMKRLITRRSSTNVKRKGSEPKVAEEGEQDDRIQKDHLPSFVLSRSISSSSKVSKSPRVNTGSTVAAMASQMAVLGSGGSLSASAVPAPPSPWAQAKSAMKRSRSRSDLTKAAVSQEGNNLNPSGPMVQQGGPSPGLALSPPPRGMDMARTAQMGDDEDDDNDDNEDDGFTMDLKPYSSSYPPTLEGFQSHVQQIFPDLPQYLIERVSNEQIRRFTWLVDLRTAHAKAVRNGKCSSGKYCFALKGKARALPVRSRNRDLGNSTTGARLSPNLSADNKADNVEDSGAVSPPFPPGIPQPPVKRLPAEFECSLCFKVKKFQKPSDWTKHVHEDVQPFTCTFSDCTDPKSFKRKADWVRHENEKHRQLEWWTCNLPECSHTCYRRDNFVQHLVREHKRPELRVKPGRREHSRSTSSAGRDTTELNRESNENASHEEAEKMSELVEECRHDTQKTPKEEPCKFCGIICSSWKKLTVHLAKHMERISLPVLEVVDRQGVAADNSFGPNEQQHPHPAPPPLSFQVPATQRMQAEAEMSNPQTLVSNGNLNGTNYSPPMEPEYPIEAAAPATSQFYSAAPAYTSPTEIDQSMGSYVGGMDSSFPGFGYPQPSVMGQPQQFLPVNAPRAYRSTHPGMSRNAHMSTSNPPSSMGLSSAAPTASYQQQDVYAGPTSGSPYLSAPAQTSSVATVGLAQYGNINALAYAQATTGALPVHMTQPPNFSYQER